MHWYLIQKECQQEVGWKQAVGQIWLADCTLRESSGWGDERSHLKELVQVTRFNILCYSLPGWLSLPTLKGMFLSMFACWNVCKLQSHQWFIALASVLASVSTRFCSSNCQKFLITLTESLTSPPSTCSCSLIYLPYVICSNSTVCRPLLSNQLQNVLCFLTTWNQRGLCGGVV